MHRALRIPLTLAIVLALGVVFDRWPASSRPPLGGAEWIWTAEGTESAGATALYLMRQFTLEPAEVGRPAILAVRGDHEYQLFVNGRWIASGLDGEEGLVDRWRLDGGFPFDTNQIVIQVRSPHGAGGLLAAVWIEGDPSPRVVSDDEWTVSRSAVPGLTEGMVALSETFVASLPRALSWGAPPVGRWGYPKLGEVRPAPAREPVPVRPVGIRWRPDAASLDRLRQGWLGSGSPSSATLDDAARAAGAVASGVLDFGEPVEGQTELLIPAGAPVRRLWFGQELVDLEGPADAELILVPGERAWLDAVERRFRYLRVEGPEPPAAVRLFRLRPGRLEPRRSQQGPWGLRRPPSAASVWGETAS